MSNPQVGGYYEIGDEIVGEEVEAMMGEAYGQERFAAGAAGRRPQYNRGQYGPPQLGRGQSLLREKNYTKSRQYVLGFDSATTIAAAAASNLTIQPQVLFRPERLVVSSTCATSFIITDLKVGKNSQLGASGNIPADMFQPGAFGVRLKCDTAQVSAVITLAVSNISLAAVRFLAGLVGEAVE